MSVSPITSADRGPDARRPPPIWPGVALAAVCLLLAGSGRAVAEQSGDLPGEADASASLLIDTDRDPDATLPLAFKPQAPKPLVPADLPPSNVLLGGGIVRAAGGVHGTSIVFGHDWRAGRAEYRPIIEREALANGLPPALLDAVMAVESHYNPAVIGFDGEIGLMQVLPSTARMMGFAGTDAQLAAPEINIHYGAQYLAGAWRRAGEDLCTATMKYRAGHGETRFSFRSVDYCVRVRSHLAAQGVAVSGTVPQPTFGLSVASATVGNASTNGSATGARARGRGRSLSIGSTVDYSALNSRLRALTEKIAMRTSH